MTTLTARSVLPMAVITEIAVSIAMAVLAFIVYAALVIKQVLR